MLYDKEFLKELDKTKNKIVYAKVTALTVEESPIESIEGRVTQGSINLDGASAVRRSCSLSIVAENFDYSDYLWGMNTKFKLEVGLQNDINDNFPKIIWFNQGIYIITSFNTSRTTNNFTITIQGKDKMCLLNGEVSGTIGVQTDFGTIEEEDNEGTWTIRQIPIPEIIRNMVHAYGGEPYHNIIIKDLDTLGLELLEYRYENMPLVMYRKEESNTYTNIAFLDSDMYLYANKNDVGNVDKRVYLKNIPNTHFEQLIDGIHTSDPVVYYDDDKVGYKLTKLQYGDTAGYRTTELTYAGDLIANVGESITSVLDKIKNMLVEFEYFYDVDGRFIFQKKQSYTQTLWSPSGDGEEGITEGLLWSDAAAYTFSGSELITGFNNNPNLLNLRNDFSIWGERTGVSGAQIPIHLRYAIDEKPTAYTTISLTDFDKNEVDEYNLKYGTNLNNNPTSITYSIHPNISRAKNYVYVTDWREVLFQMAKDYFRYNTLSDFEIRVREANPTLYPFGRTGYEQYYTDIQVCWRQLYNPELRNKIADYTEEVATLTNEVTQLDKEIKDIENRIIELNNQLNTATTQSSIDSIVLSILSEQQSRTDKKALKSQKEYLIEQKQESLDSYNEDILNYYQAQELMELDVNLFTTQFPLSDSQITIDILDRFRVPKNLINELLDEKTGEPIAIKANDILYFKEDDSYFSVINNFDDYVIIAYYDKSRLHWHKNVFENPGSLNYWFDFLDTAGELSQYSVRAIGARTKAINENTVKSIYFRETPPVIFAPDITDDEKMSGYKYIQIPEFEMDKMFSISAQGKSAKERLDELLYNHGYCTESATITTIPVYYLQPNIRIKVSDEKTKIDGEYIVSKLTIPLAYNGTMQLTTTKAAQTLFF